jgi:hypothetical protein
MNVKICPTCGERWWCIKCGYCHFRTAGGCCRNAAGRQPHAASPGGEPPVAAICKLIVF